MNILIRLAIYVIAVKILNKCENNAANLKWPYHEKQLQSLETSLGLRALTFIQIVDFDLSRHFLLRILPHISARRYQSRLNSHSCCVMLLFSLVFFCLIRSFFSQVAEEGKNKYPCQSIGGYALFLLSSVQGCNRARNLPCNCWKASSWEGRVSDSSFKLSLLLLLFLCCLHWRLSSLSNTSVVVQKYSLVTAYQNILALKLADKSYLISLAASLYWRQIQIQSLWIMNSWRPRDHSGNVTIYLSCPLYRYLLSATSAQRMQG